MSGIHSHLEQLFFPVLFYINILPVFLLNLKPVWLEVQSFTHDVLAVLAVLKYIILAVCSGSEICVSCILKICYNKRRKMKYILLIDKIRSSHMKKCLAMC